jgi:hypothetical protein
MPQLHIQHQEELLHCHLSPIVEGENGHLDVLAAWLVDMVAAWLVDMVESGVYNEIEKYCTLSSCSSEGYTPLCWELYKFPKVPNGTNDTTRKYCGAVL